MESDDEALLSDAQETHVQPPIDEPAVSHQQQQVTVGQPTTSTPGQPIMYQLAPGQQQPVFIQVPAGQPATTLKGQPFQYYYVPVLQLGQPAQPGQPVFVQGNPGQPTQPGQPVFVQGGPSQHVQPKQPVFVQRDSGQPAEPEQSMQGQVATTLEGQPIQYYYVPVSNAVQSEQPVQSRQPMLVQGFPGQPAQPGQPVFVQGVPGQPVQSQQQAGGGGFELIVDTDFLKSPPCFIKIAEFVTLLGAWASILKYLAIGSGNNNFEDDKANFFEGIMIFSWVVVILYIIIYTFSFPKICKCKQPSIFTITSVFFYFILFSLLLSCTGNLVPRAVDFGKFIKVLPTDEKDEEMPYFIALDVALAFGFLSCILFVVDMVLNYRLFQTQRAQETLPDQGPPQRRVWDINQEYLRSPVFYIKLIEVALLFAAWVCILKYFDMDSIKDGTIQDLSKEEFFRGITIFSWVMVILLALTFLFSFDKICSRSSPWALATFLFYAILAILLAACCGDLTPRAVDLAKSYTNVPTERRPNVLSLLIGLGFGYIAWIIFVVDIALLYKWYRQQRMQEFPPQPQQTSQQVVQQPAVVITPQYMAHGGNFFQPTAHPGQSTGQCPGQQPVQYPGQQPVVIGMPPPGFSPQPQQEPTQN